MVFVGSESERMEDVYRYTSFELSRSMHVVRVRTVCNTTSILFKTECKLIEKTNISTRNFRPGTN